jgi:hypothetical protein
VEAPFAGCRDDALLLLSDDGPEAVRFDEMAALWARERHAGRGARTGAIIGAAGGGALFFLLGMIVEAVGESEEDVDILPLTLAGVGLGAGAGALSGAIVGSAIPRWCLLRARAGAPAEATRRTDAHPTHPAHDWGRIGSLGLAMGLGWAEGAEADAAGAAWSLTLTADYPGGLSFGPEFGLVDAGPQDVGYDGPPASTYQVADRVWHLGILVRYAVRVGAIRPYAVVGLAGYNWEDSFLGASIGSGVALPLRERRLTARVEYRRHDNIQNLVLTDPGFGALTAGINYGW